MSQVLGVSRDADAATIRQAYHRKSLQLHPDKNPGDPTAEKAAPPPPPFCIHTSLYPYSTPHRPTHPSPSISFSVSAFGLCSTAANHPLHPLPSTLARTASRDPSFQSAGFCRTCCRLRNRRQCRHEKRVSCPRPYRAPLITSRLLPSSTPTTTTRRYTLDFPALYQPTVSRATACTIFT